VYGEKNMLHCFYLPFIIIAALCLIVYCIGASISKGKKPRLHSADGYIIVFSAWIFMCAFGAIPFALSGYYSDIPSAIFESASGFTTTGSTMLADVESIPKSILMWRGLTHWIGGMGIVVLMVALLPILGMGGFQMLEAESPGPEADRIVPRITPTAKILWLLYVSLTFLCCILLKIGGMPWFDALFNAFSTLGTGGFSTRNASIASYASPFCEWVIIIFMLLAGFNFTLIFRSLQGKFKEVITNSEARAYFLIILVATAVVAISLGRSGGNVRHGLFHIVSTITTTGFSVANQDAWPSLAQVTIFFMMFIGGCSGSTAGGIKVVRHVILWKQAGNEMKKMIYPKGVFSIRLNGNPAKKEIVHGIAGFVFLYYAVLVLSFLVIASSGLNIWHSFNLSLITLGNIGMGFGGTDHLLQGLPAWQKVYISLVMIIGRLELMSFFVFCSKDYWERP
jgi:trk system potassium uptake protein TrkH